jgi:hypothetical protein
VACHCVCVCDVCMDGAGGGRVQLRDNCPSVRPSVHLSVSLYVSLSHLHVTHSSCPSPLQQLVSQEPLPDGQHGAEKKSCWTELGGVRKGDKKGCCGKRNEGREGGWQGRKGDWSEMGRKKRREIKLGTQSEPSLHPSTITRHFITLHTAPLFSPL